MLCDAGFWSSRTRDSRPAKDYTGGCEVRGPPGGRVMEGAMFLSFWMVMFMLLPTVGLGAFVWLMNRQQEHHR
jgi:hypothetical protein